MNVLYCGSEIRGNVIAEYCRRKKDKIEFTGSKNHINEYDTKIFTGQYEVIVIDVTQLIDDTQIITDYICRVKKAKTSQIVIFAEGFTYRSRLIEELLSKGFTNFILATGLATQADEWEKCITGYYTENTIEQDLRESAEAEQEQKKQQEKIISIAVAGTMNRIGTTTQALQLVRYCMSKGYKAAYVEINDTNFIESCHELYADVKEEGDNGIIYNDLYMFKSDKLAEVLKKFDILICDYGSITSPSFNKISFATQQIKFLVAGTKPGEITAVQNTLQSPAYNEAAYIFSFVPETDQKDILEMMCEKQDSVIFAATCFDPFDYVQCNYDKLLTLEDVTTEEKTGFFTRFKRKKHEK